MTTMKSNYQKLLAMLPTAYKAGSIAAAVSGGADSVAMLLLLHHQCRMKKIRLCVFHVDHAMRPSSEEDRKWVGRLAERLGLSFYWRRASDKDCDSGREKLGEAWARKFRYRCFADMLAESDCEAVATGHTLDDQAETVLMRLIRGCSLQGFGGIRMNRVRTVEGRKIRIIRPLLSMTRDKIVSMLRESDQEWREDETNAGDDYFRNRIRHHLVPVIIELGQNSREHVAEAACDIARIQKYLGRRAGSFLKKYSGEGWLEVSRRPAEILRFEILRLWFIQNDLAEKISRALLERVDRLWRQNVSGKMVDHRNFQVIRRKNKIYLQKND